MKVSRPSCGHAFALSVLVAALASPVARGQEEGSGKRQGEGRIPFSSDLRATLERARESGKPVVLAFAAVWCPNCRRMKEITLRSPLVLELVDSFHWVMIDIDRNLTLANEYDVVATPQIYFLDAKGDARRRIVGMVPPQEYRAKLLDFLDEVETQPEAAVMVEDEGLYSRTDLTFSPRGYRGLSVCFSHVGYGPLRITSQSPFQSLRLSLIPRTPSTLAKRQWELKAAGTWANVWAIDNDEDFAGEISEAGEYLLDYETLHTGVALAYGVSDTLQLEVGFENQNRFGGEMDSLIQGFHDLVGVDQNGRDLVPKDDFTFALDPPDGQPSVFLGPRDKGTFARHAQFTVQHNVTCGTAKLPAFSYAVTGRWGLESDDLEGDDFDYGVSVAVSRRFKNFYGYATLGYAWFGSDRFRGLELRETQFSGLLAFEWRWRPRMSWLVQYLVSEGVAARRFDPFSKASHELTFGWKWEVVPQSVLEIGAVENLVTFDNSADFGIHAGWTQRF